MAANSPADRLPTVKVVLDEVKEVIVAQDGDVWVTARELVRRGRNDNSLVKTYQDSRFKAVKKTLSDNSTYFKGQFGPHFAELKVANQPLLEKIHIKALEIVLQVLHKSESEIGIDASAYGVWHTISVCDRLQINHKSLAGWFKKWYKRNRARLFSHCNNHHDEDNDNCQLRSMLFPCYAFDHAEGFSEVTKHLVYNSCGRVSEYNPTWERHLSTPIRIVQQLNGARGRIRTLLEKAIHKPIIAFMDNEVSTCKYRVTYEFFQELRRLDLFPSLEVMAAKTALSELINQIQLFTYESPEHYESNCRRWSCKVNFSEHVRSAGEKYEDHFDGLCLDCIAKGKEEEDPRSTEECVKNRGLQRWCRGWAEQHV